MKAEPDRTSLQPSRSGVLLVDAYKVDLVIDHGQLVVRAITGRDHREGRFARPTSGLRRLLVRSVTGYASWQALDWFDAVGAELVRVDVHGRPFLATSRLGRDDPALRRAQAASFGTEVGMACVRDLIEMKCRGQQAIMRERGLDAADQEIERAILSLPAATTPAEILLREAAAAAVFWTGLADTPVTWARSERGKVPSHWLTVGPRTSPLTGSPRSAATPAQALWNYISAVGEIAARIACAAMGLDGSLGLLHRDAPSRSSLALDCLEAVRPDQDRYVLDLIERRTFRRADFIERPNGTVRLMPTLARELADTLPVWEARLAPVVEGVARAIADGTSARVRPLPTLLTGANRSAGRDALRRRQRSSALPKATTRGTCRTCGEAVPSGRVHCDTCAPEVIQSRRAAFVTAGHAQLRRQRDAGNDPSHGGDAARSRGRKVSDSRRAAAEWEWSNGPLPDPEVFRREVLPLLAGVSAGRLAEMTGLSRPYCAAILRGERVPHARWWDTLHCTVVIAEPPRQNSPLTAR